MLIKKKCRLNLASVLWRGTTVDLVVGDSDEAELLSRYFKSVFTADDDKVHDVKSHIDPDDALSSVVFNPQCVLRILLKLNVNSSGGPDGIKPILLKNIASACNP